MYGALSPINMSTPSDLVPETGTSMVLTDNDSQGNNLVPQSMGPMDSLRSIFEEIRDGINTLVDLAYSGSSTKGADLNDTRDEGITDADVMPEDTDSQGNKGGFGFKMPEFEKPGPKLGLALLLGGLATIMQFGDKLVPIIAPILKAINENILPNVIDFFKDFYDSAVDLFTNIKDKVTTIFGGKNPDGSDATILDRLTALGGIFTDFAGFILNIGDSLITNVLEMFGVNFDPYDSAGAYVLGKLNEMWTGITGFFSDAKDFVVDGVTGVSDYVVQKVMAAFEGVTTWFSETGTFLLEGATGIIDWIKGKLALPFEFLTDLFSFTEEDATAGGIATKLLDIILLPYNLAINFLRGIFGFGEDEEGNLEPFSLGEFIIDKIKSAIKFLKDMFSFDIDSIIPSLPNIGDAFMSMIGKMLPSPDSFIGKALYALPGTDALEQAAESYANPTSEPLMTQDDVLEISSDASLQKKESILTQGLENSLENQEKITNAFGRNSPEYEEEVMRFHAIDNKLTEVQNEQMKREETGSVTTVIQDNKQVTNSTQNTTEQTPGLAATENDYTAKALSAFASGRYAGGF